MATYVRICVFEAQKFVHLRAILVDFPDTKYQELPGAYLYTEILISNYAGFEAIFRYFQPTYTHNGRSKYTEQHWTLFTGLFSLCLHGPWQLTNTRRTQ